MNNINNIFKTDGFDFAISMDCEGTNFDKNLENNVKNLETFLKLASDNNICTILFISPYFANMLNELSLVEKIKQYNVIFGLHIHPDNLPNEIKVKCPFIKENEELLSFYPYEEQKLIISNCMDYLHKKGIKPIEIYRGGYFSMNVDTSKALLELTDIKYESHNIYREQYSVTNSLLTPIPVYAFDKDTEFRLDSTPSKQLSQMLLDAIKTNKKVLGITHSYLLDPNDFHYKRDNIKEDIHFKLSQIIKTIKNSISLENI
ncbi:hypothetical protein SAMN05216497_101148 [Clostridium cochlearium]|uniref:Polysaccharide deacetylase n=1 Tax=Clostridium cochlearium TaxID=1494 RepID=A0ABY0QI11_CLOCO|nr:hypothetical protein [Clostridium cochlearium]SDK83190.1 hypothetical protein SAMN05216497_101148 [Clostridium cochlearium]